MPIPKVSGTVDLTSVDAAIELAIPLPSEVLRPILNERVPL